jgi:hypothetical protein
MLHDKKMDAGTLPFVLMKGIGEAFLAKDVALDDVAAHSSTRNWRAKLRCFRKPGALYPCPPHTLSRHPGLDPGSSFPFSAALETQLVPGISPG